MPAENGENQDKDTLCDRLQGVLDEDSKHIIMVVKIPLQKLAEKQNMCT